MRALIVVLCLLPCLALAQGAPIVPSRPPIPPGPPGPPGPPPGPWPDGPPPPGGGGYWPGGGCWGCSYSGGYYNGSVSARPPAPPQRIQGQWRNGQWYY